MARRYDPNIHHRQSTRLHGYNYAQTGAYFVTICTQNRRCLFGKVVNGEMQLNDVGEIVAACWHNLPHHFPHVALNAFVLMPNHVHGIVFIGNHTFVGAAVRRPPTATHVQADQGAETAPLHHAHESTPVGAGAPRQTPADHTHVPALGQIVAYFKYQATKHINVLRNTPSLPVWQRNYYDHIIRNHAGLDRIRHYIVTNSLRWDGDQLHPANPSRW